MEEKMARICWNSNNWKKPSGRIGKSIDASSYEYKNGFGHEEWLFDLEKTIGGYHYGAIQPIGKHQNTYQGKDFKILLYTYKADDKDWYWVGWLNNIKVISKNEAIEVYEEYKKKGWIDLMKNELVSVGANQNELNTFSGYCFNIKFIPNDATFVNNGLQLFDNNQKIIHNRYTLLNIDKNILKPFDKSNIQIVSSNLNSNHKETITKSFKEYSKEYEFTHGIIQDRFYNFLKQSFTNDKINKEARITTLNCSIDIYQEKENGIKIIYEIKTYMDLRYSIRVAIGQLLEYAFYPNRNENYKLVIISNKNISDDIKEYINILCEKFNLNIGIINFDLINNKIIEQYNCNGCDFA
jgi:hypothetical protein